jgi:hypothetical protein
MPPRTAYPHLRAQLGGEFAERSDERIEAALEKLGMDAEAAEGFFSDLGKFASSAGQSILKAAPSILPVAGSVAGTFLGGPLGASIGGQLGSLAGQAVGGATGQRSGGPAFNLGGLLSGFGGSSAAGQMLQTILKPQTLQAVASMAMGGLGKPNVSVGGTQVPVGAFGNLLKVLAGRMEAEYNASIASSRKDTPTYMQDYAGEAKGDPAIPDHRAEALFELLSAESGGESAEWAEQSESESEMEAMQAEYDALELAELYESEEA